MGLVNRLRMRWKQEEPHSKFCVDKVHMALPCATLAFPAANQDHNWEAHRDTQATDPRETIAYLPQLKIASKLAD